MMCYVDDFNPASISQDETSINHSVVYESITKSSVNVRRDVNYP